jgi:hypothetical protein
MVPSLPPDGPGALELINGDNNQVKLVVMATYCRYS